MSNELSGRAREILLEKNFATVSTLRQDGTVYAVVVWVDADDEGYVLLNTAEGRAWRKNIARDPRVTLTVAHHANPYEYVSVTGTVVEDTHDGADQHINRMAKKYVDQDVYPFRQPGEQRVKIRVRPDRVTLAGGAS